MTRRERIFRVGDVFARERAEGRALGLVKVSRPGCGAASHCVSLAQAKFRDFFPEFATAVARWL